MDLPRGEKYENLNWVPYSLLTGGCLLSSVIRELQRLRGGLWVLLGLRGSGKAQPKGLR